MFSKPQDLYDLGLDRDLEFSRGSILGMSGMSGSSGMSGISRMLRMSGETYRHQVSYVFQTTRSI